MKRACLLIFCVVLYINFIFSQKEVKEDIEGNALEEKTGKVFRPLAAIGFNASQIEGDDMKGYNKLGLNTSIGALIRIKEKWSITTEVGYSQKGANGTEFSTKIPKKIVLDYAEIPVYASFHDKKVAMFGAGLVFSGLVRNKFYLNGEDVTTASTVPTYRKFDVSGMANINFIFKKHYGLNLRWMFSMFTIDKVKQYNNTLALRGMYIF